MKVLMINTVATERNGVTNVICNLHAAMDKSDMTVDLLAINTPDEIYNAQFAAAGGKVTVLARSIAHPLRYVNALKKHIRENGYDIVHAHGNSATLALEMLAAKLGGCKVRIAHSHNTTCTFMAVHKLLQPLFLSLSTHCLACSEAAGKWLFGKRSFTVVNNGIQTARFTYDRDARQQLRQQLGVADGCKLIGHVGLFNEAKNQGFLIELMHRLAAAGEDYKLVLVGQGQLREAARQQVQAMGLEDRVIFVGITDQVRSYLSAFDVFCMPSLYEGLPVALIEAQTAGLPCVVADTITREADKTGNMTFLPIDRGTAVWEETLKTFSWPEDRQSYANAAVESICRCGYDISYEAGKMKDYYRNED